MTKVFKNHVLSTFIAIAFLLSQIVNANANHLNSSFQKENVSVSVIEKATNMATLYISNLNYGVGNEDGIEGKFVKVFEPITLGAFTTIGAYIFGGLTGLVMSVFSAMLGGGIARSLK
ncbi:MULTISPECIES: hypothetical protein [unclassified Bartonella]|uniref:hypothetical protein n=1 Tax=unclassified Bartonella TaxID=2645622 RepID=UPI0035CFB9BC